MAGPESLTTNSNELDREALLEGMDRERLEALLAQMDELEGTSDVEAEADAVLHTEIREPLTEEEKERVVAEFIEQVEAYQQEAIAAQQTASGIGAVAIGSEMAPS